LMSCTKAASASSFARCCPHQLRQTVTTDKPNRAYLLAAPQPLHEIMAAKALHKVVVVREFVLALLPLATLFLTWWAEVAEAAIFPVAAALCALEGARLAPPQMMECRAQTWKLGRAEEAQ